MSSDPVVESNSDHLILNPNGLYTVHSSDLSFPVDVLRNSMHMPHLMTEARSVGRTLFSHKVKYDDEIALVIPKGESTEDVMGISGILLDDASLEPTFDLIRAMGNVPHSSGIGRNIHPVQEAVPKIIEEIERITDASGRPIILLGLSLGGTLAKLASDFIPDPERIKAVIAIAGFMNTKNGATIAAITAFGPVFALGVALRGRDKTAREIHILEQIDAPVKVPHVCIYSEEDHVVPFKASMRPDGENIKAKFSHLQIMDDRHVKEATILAFREETMQKARAKMRV